MASILSNNDFQIAAFVKKLAHRQGVGQQRVENLDFLGNKLLPISLCLLMEDDILIDVFRSLSRKQLSQSVALVCRHFHYLVNSPALPNLHCINCIQINPMWDDAISKTWGFVIWCGSDPHLKDQGFAKDFGNTYREFGDTYTLITYEELQTTHRPTQYLRCAHLHISPKHLAKDQWRKCFWEFRHCFADCALKLTLYAQFTAVEFQCFLADWILRLFPNCTFFFYIGRIISSTENKHGDLPTLETLANFHKSKFLQFGAKDRQAIASSLKPSLLISLPSILNSPCVEISACGAPYTDAFWDPFVLQEDVIQWLHHVTIVPTTTTINRYLCKSKRNLFLSSAMLKPREEDRRDEWYDQIAEVACGNLVKQLKQRFLQANTPDKKREFYLELYVVTFPDTRRLEPFDIQNNATNERLTLKIFGADYYNRSNTWELLRESV